LQQTASAEECAEIAQRRAEIVGRKKKAVEDFKLSGAGALPLGLTRDLSCDQSGVDREGYAGTWPYLLNDLDPSGSQSKGVQ